MSAASFVSKKKKTKSNIIKVIDAKDCETLCEAKIFTIKQDTFKTSINKAFFIPNKLNCKINQKFNDVHTKLLNQWWNKIETSGKINQNKGVLADYRTTLKTGDLTLLGLVTDGGQGMATGDNGKYVGVLANSKSASRVLLSRKKKLEEFNKKYKTDYILPKSEKAIWKMFDQIKQKYGRRIFGKGCLYRIVSDDLLADLQSLTEDERENGIVGYNSFVPYDKGDRDGNRWYLETPYVIDWSKKKCNTFKK